MGQRTNLTKTRKKALVATLFILILSVALMNCGEGGEGSPSPGGTTATPTTQPTKGQTTQPAKGPTTQAAKFPGFSLSLSTGTYWHYSYSSGSATGVFQVTLGAPTSIGGVTAYKVVVTGGGSDVAPRWKYLASKDNQLLGSTDGITLQVILDAQSGMWQGGGFFTNYPQATWLSLSECSLSPGKDSSFAAPTSAVKTSLSKGKPSSETIEGQTFYNSTSFSLSEAEYYKAGIGPIGYYYSESSYVSGGSFQPGASYSLKKDVRLLATSLKAADGSVLKPPWVWRSTIPAELSSYATAAVGNKIYVIGGYAPSKSANPSNAVNVYDTVTNTWTTGKPMPEGRWDHTAQAANGKIYVIGGRLGGERGEIFADTVLVYDPSADVWTKTRPMYLTAPYSPRSTYFLGYIFIISNPMQTALVLYDPVSGTWERGRDLTNGSGNSGALTSMNRTLYLIGGTYKASGGPWLHALGPSPDWTDKSEMQTKRECPTTAVVNEKIYVLGGDESIWLTPNNLWVQSDYRTVEVYDPATDKWVVKSPLPLPLSGGRNAAVVNNKIYAFLGTAVFEYDPSKDN